MNREITAGFSSSRDAASSWRPRRSFGGRRPVGPRPSPHPERPEDLDTGRRAGRPIPVPLVFGPGSGAMVGSAVGARTRAELRARTSSGSSVESSVESASATRVQTDPVGRPERESSLRACAYFPPLGASSRLGCARLPRGRGRERHGRPRSLPLNGDGPRKVRHVENRASLNDVGLRRHNSNLGLVPVCLTFGQTVHHTLDRRAHRNVGSRG